MVVDRHWTVKDKNDPFVVPSFETISFSLPSLASWENLLKGEQDGWVYLSDGNPTLAALEKLLAKIQGVETCWVTSTGKSAIAASLMALLKQGDHLILLREGYKSTRLFAETVLKKFGVEVTLLGVDELGELEATIKPGQTKVLVLEAPTNPVTRVPDLTRCAEIARKHDVMTILDNSLSGFHQHGNIPVDLIVHSLSKFASGVGDVMGGAVLGSKEKVSQVKTQTSGTLMRSAAMPLSNYGKACKLTTCASSVSRLMHWQLRNSSANILKSAESCIPDWKATPTTK